MSTDFQKRAAGICIGLFISLNSGTSFSQDNRIEAVRVEDSTNEIFASTTIITEKEIRAQKATSVVDILRDIPGVELARQGGPGQTASIFIRGARSEDTLVLIDGMEVNDRMSPAGGYDFASLSAANIARIEIYRGPQSLRFGAGALGGVINIITKAGDGNSHLDYLLESGSYSTNRAVVGASGGSDEWGYAWGLESFQSQGLSAAAGSVTNEADGTSIQSGSVKLSWRPHSLAKVEATLRYLNAKTDLDQQGGAAGDDPDEVGRMTQLTTGLYGEDSFWQGRLKSSVLMAFSEVNRETKNSPDKFSAVEFSDHFLSENKKWQIENAWRLDARQSLQLHLQAQNESGVGHSRFAGVEDAVDRKTQSVLGAGLSYVYESETWYADMGMRSDQSSVVGSIPSARALLGRNFESSRTKVDLTYGTGFKLPSLYQLYSSYGDTHLHQENSESVELSLEQELSPHLFMSLGFFRNHFRDMIDFDLQSSRYFNVAKARSQGVETEVQLKILATLSLKFGYSYLETRDEDTGLELLRRPRHAGSLKLDSTGAQWESFIRYRYRGSRTDLDPATFARVTNSAYDLTDVGGTWKFSKALKVQGRIENIFNRTYEEVLGYGTPGISFYLGLAGDI